MPRRLLGDGFLTKTNTFQKFYAPGELEDLLESVLNAEAITLSFGICAVFKDPDAAELFEASRSRRRIDWTQIGTQLQFASASRGKLESQFEPTIGELLDLLAEVPEAIPSAAGG